VALLGSAIEADPSLKWLWSMLELPQSSHAAAPKSAFEYELDQQTLNEQPHVTNVDLLVEGEDVLLCLEAKFWEQGLGSCRCGQEKSDADPADEGPELEPSSAQERGACSTRILERPAYWSASCEVLGLPERVEGRPCPIAASYQAVRNVAAARALAARRSRKPAFALLYDERNPYFSLCGEWPGWPAALTDLIRDERGVKFRSCSWQRLLASGAVPTDVVAWARDKHGLISSPPT
jgi:restriction endonuclease-like protein